MADWLGKTGPCRIDGRRPFGRRAPIRAWQCAHPAQQPLVRAAHQPDMAVALDPPAMAQPVRLHLFRCLDRKSGRVGSCKGSAVLPQRTNAAGRVTRRADGRAQIHHGLRKIAGPRVRCNTVGGGADCRARGRQRGINGKQARHHPFDIGVHHHRPPAKGDRRDGGSGIGAHAWQAAQPLLGIGKASAMVTHHRPRAGKQIARPRIITKPRPCRHDVRVLRRRQLLHSRPAGGESGEIGPNRRHCRLLQHHFGQPDTIGVARIGARRRAPGQAARMNIIMRKQVTRDF